MSSQKYTTSVNNPIIKELVDAKIIPDNCIRFTLEASVNEAIIIKSECFATEEQVRMIADALLSNPEAVKQIARTIILKSQENLDYPRVVVDL